MLNKKITLHFFLISAITLVTFVDPTQAAGSKPRLQVDCGQLTGGIDKNGTYGLFKPDVAVAYYGLPLTVTSYYYEKPTTPKSETGQQIITFTGKAASTKFAVSSVNIEQKILEFSRPESGYYKFVIEAVDTLKRKATTTCLYKDYYFDLPIISNSGTSGSSSGNSNNYSRGLNRNTCTFNGKKLYGSVYVTSSPGLADLSVYIASSPGLADLSVYLASSPGLTSSCGSWYKTTSFGLADFSIYVTSSPGLADISVYLTSSPGLAGT